MDKAAKENQRETMRSMIEQWHASGKSQIQFYTDNQIKPSQFYYWLKRYRQMITPGVFLPVQVIRSKQSQKSLDTPIEIHYPNGTRVHLPSTVSLATIRTLIGM